MSSEQPQDPARRLDEQLKAFQASYHSVHEAIRANNFSDYFHNLGMFFANYPDITQEHREGLSSEIELLRRDVDAASTAYIDDVIASSTSGSTTYLYQHFSQAEHQKLLAGLTRDMMDISPGLKDARCQTVF